MMEFKFFVTLEVPDDCLSDECYDNTNNIVYQKLEEAASALGGSVEDVEWK